MVRLLLFMKFYSGIKINTINLADDISRSMGVGAVRIAQIYGTIFRRRGAK